MSDPAILNKPAYVNLQAGPVQVFDENRTRVTVQPWANKNRADGSTYVVYGAHYQQFVGANGPLYPFPGPRNTQAQAAAGADPNAPTPVGLAASGDRDAAKRAKLMGKMRLTATVEREGQVVGEAPEAFAARVRGELEARGVRSARDLERASSAILLDCPSISHDNLARVRETANLVFAGTDRATDPGLEPVAETTTPPPAANVDPLDPDPAGGDLWDEEVGDDPAEGALEEEEPTETDADEEEEVEVYDRAVIEKMRRRVDLAGVVEESELDLDPNAYTKVADLRVAVIEALEARGEISD